MTAWRWSPGTTAVFIDGKAFAMDDCETTKLREGSEAKTLAKKADKGNYDETRGFIPHVAEQSRTPISREDCQTVFAADAGRE